MPGFERKGRWDVQVSFKGYMTFGIKSRSDIEQTPDNVILELEAFIKRIKRTRRLYYKRLREIAADPVLRAKAIKHGIPLPMQGDA